MTQTPPPTSLSTAGQWNLLQHHLFILSHSSTQQTPTSPPLWLSSLDRRLLLTALVKQREELDLLRAEAEHIPLFSQFAITLPSSEALLPPKFGAEGFPTTDLRSPKSPGRRNSSFAARRRLHASGGSPGKSSESDEEERSSARRLASRDWEQRVQWEAAWCWMEKHLDFYADKFRVVDPKPGGRKMALWEELVKMRWECEGLGRRLREFV